MHDWISCSKRQINCIRLSATLLPPLLLPVYWEIMGAIEIPYYSFAASVVPWENTTTFLPGIDWHKIQNIIFYLQNLLLFRYWIIRQAFLYRFSILLSLYLQTGGSYFLRDNPASGMLAALVASLLFPWFSLPTHSSSHYSSRYTFLCHSPCG